MGAIGLTAEQRQKIGAIVEESHAKRIALRQEMLALRSGQPDAAALANARERMFTLAQQRREQIAAVLTPEQREGLREGWRGR